MDGGGDNQLTLESFLEYAFLYFEADPAHNIPPPDPAQGGTNADALNVVLHAYILSEMSNDSGFESGSESD